MSEHKLPKFILLFDEDCPLCVQYASIFQKINLLPKESFIPWAKGIEIPNLDFDFELSKDKIALLNTETNENLYGIDSILEIISYRFPSIKNLGKSQPIYFFLTKLYTFIAHNRKIFAAKDCGDHCPCIPTKNYGTRVILILISALIVNYFTSIYFTNTLSQFYIANAKYGDLGFFFGQILFQFVVFKLLAQKNFYNYAGHVSFVSVLGAFLLGIAYYGLKIISNLGVDTELLGYVSYGVVLCFMFYEHRRRVRIEGWSHWLTVSWCVYRLLIYPLAFRI